MDRKARRKELTLISMEKNVHVEFHIIDFTVTLSSPESFCVLFDIPSEHCRTEMASIEQTQKMIPFVV